MYIQHNANPYARNVGDCTVRAISRALGEKWETTYCGMCAKGYAMCDMPSANSVWGAYLRDRGFGRAIIDDDRADGYTVRNFCEDHKKGNFVLALSGHAVCVIDGNYYDTFDSGDLIVLYYFYKREEEE